ncbi:tyrosine-protein phosphatase corkscrew-like [Artemia franciscana]|uniref:tyrosine-protein phosphatase corkscrew-like n=1 Tax=Artemia franciscana TaxID=6661 RepID=UPI0032D9F265
MYESLLSLESNLVSSVDTEQDLGITIDNELKFSTHAKKSAAGVSSTMRLIEHTLSTLLHKIICLMYKGFEHQNIEVGMAEASAYFKKVLKDAQRLDHTRVVLTEVSNELGADYINANYIRFEDDVDRNSCGYIATQGCLPGSINDFWHMAWQENSRVIVMTTKEVERGKSKCAVYWPKEGETKECGNIAIKFSSETTTADYALREFIVTKADSDEERKVYHYHFQAWPDHGVPADPGCVLNFLHDVNSRQEAIEGAGPIIVHCSAGIGRTGTFIVIDMILTQIKKHGTNCEIDIQRTIQTVRSQRSGMVQTEAQYKFVYMAVQHYMETSMQRMQAERKSALVGRDYTNIRYSSEAVGLSPLTVSPQLAASTPVLPAMQSGKLDEKGPTKCTSEVHLAKNVDEAFRPQIYENIPSRDKKPHLLPLLTSAANIGPPPSFAAPPPPS